MEEGYRSRASYKLKQIHERFGVFNNAKYVLDLGAAPGGWLQVASDFVNEEGLVLGVDLDEIEPIPVTNVVTIQGDVRDPEIQAEIQSRFKAKIDVLLSDMAPDVIGQWDVDQYRQIHLARIALNLANILLKADGWLVVKIFQGGEHNRFIKEVKDMFEFVKNYKPPASRKGSAERYIVAHRLKPDRKSSHEPAQVRLVFEETEGPIPGDQLFYKNDENQRTKAPRGLEEH